MLSSAPKWVHAGRSQQFPDELPGLSSWYKRKVGLDNIACDCFASLASYALQLGIWPVVEDPTNSPSLICRRFIGAVARQLERQGASKCIRFTMTARCRPRRLPSFPGS